MPQDISVVLVGIGGYGDFYLRALLEEGATHQVRFVAAVDPAPERCRRPAALEAARIPLFPSLEAFFAQTTADLVILATPIHLHAPQTQLALQQGVSVLCEKPLATTIQAAHRMAQAEAAAPGLVAIGYQWSFAAAMQALKTDILAGRLGQPRRLRSKVFWPRPASYYQRSPWAARIKTDDGRWVLDSPVNNAAAHYLHNMLYVLGGARETSARPVSIEAELYRANPIENYDAAALRVMTEAGVEILFYTAHPVNQNLGPLLEYEFDAATVTYTEPRAGHLLARFKDGRIHDYGNPFADQREKLWQSVAALRGGPPPACGIAAAIPLTLCVNGAQESLPAITTFPPAIVRQETWPDGDCLTWVDGLQAAFEQAYGQGCLPAELGGVAWAQKGAVVDLRNYRHFPALNR